MPGLLSDSAVITTIGTYSRAGFCRTCCIAYKSIFSDAGAMAEADQQSLNHGAMVSHPPVTEPNHVHGMHLPGQMDVSSGEEGGAIIHYGDGRGDGGIDPGSDEAMGEVAIDAIDPNFGAHLRNQSANQLMLSFQGEVYVFHSVSPEKVQAVLLLLGGREVSPSLPSTSVPVQQNNRVTSSATANDHTRRSGIPQRLASLLRFREKRKERCFDKKIRYTVRKEVALRMQRRKGQFASAKQIAEEMATPSPGWNIDGMSQAAICQHCGKSEKSTPMMRRGPAGPRTLCNACGLKWANKGILRDLSKAGVHPVMLSETFPSTNVNEQGNAAATIIQNPISSQCEQKVLTESATNRHHTSALEKRSSVRGEM